MSFHSFIRVVVLIGAFGARFALAPESIELIQEPSRGNILSDVDPGADGEGSDLFSTLLEWFVTNCLPAVAKRTPRPSWRAAKLFTTSLCVALGARFARL